MKMKEIFALLLRVIGVLGLAYVIRNTVNCLFTTFPHPAAIWVVKQIGFALIGLYLIRGAPLLLKFAYPEESGSSADKQGTERGAA